MKATTPRGEHSATPAADAIRRIPNSPERVTCRHDRPISVLKPCSMCVRFEKP